LDDQVFADGLGQISVIGGTVRLDLVTYSPREKDPKGQPQAIFRQQIIMGVDAFLHAAEKIGEAAQALSSRAAAVRPREAQPLPQPLAQPLPQPAPPAPVSEAASAPVETPAPLGKPPFP
jgi:hypothetical protein